MNKYCLASMCSLFLKDLPLAVSKVIRIVLPSSGSCPIFLSRMVERVQTRKII